MWEPSRGSAKVEDAAGWGWEGFVGEELGGIPKDPICGIGRAERERRKRW